MTILPAGIAEAVHYSSPATHFLESSALGVLDLRDVVFHGLLTVLGLVFCSNALERRRWR